VPFDFSFLEKIDNGPVWILSETKLRSEQVQLQLADNRSIDVRVMTSADALWRLAQYLLPHKSSATGHSELISYSLRNLQLSGSQRLTVIRGLLLTNQPRFSALLSLLSGASEQNLGTLKQIAALFDALRLNEANDRLFKNIIDEFGNTRQEAESGQELVELFDLYSEFQREKLKFDSEGIKEFLVTTLLTPFPEATKNDKHFPAAILLDQPTYFFPLEKTLWQSVAQNLELHVLVDEVVSYEAETFLGEFVRPSVRHLLSVAEFIKQAKKQITTVEYLPRRNPEVDHSLISSLFDGEVDKQHSDSHDKEALPELFVLNCAEPRDEVHAVIQKIRTEIEVNNVAAKDIHLVCLDLDSYGSLLEQDSFAAQIPLTIPKGVLLTSFQSVSACRTLLKCITEPTLERFAAFINHSWFSKSVLNIESFKLFNSHFAQFLKPILSLSIFKEVSTEDHFSDYSFDINRISQVLYKHGVVVGEISEDAWIGNLLTVCAEKFAILETQLASAGKQDIRVSQTDVVRRRDEFLFLLGDLTLVWNAVQQINKLRASDGELEFANALRKFIYNQRATLSSERIDKSSYFYQRAIDEARAYRKLRQTLSYCRKQLEFEREFGETSFAKNAIEHFIELFEQEVDSLRLSPRPLDNVVVATELLDVRGIRDKVTFVLGMNAQQFPASGDRETEFGSLLNNLRQGLFLRSGWRGRVFESYWLVSHLLRNSRKLTISYSAQSVEKELFPPTFVLTLVREGRANVESVAPFRTKSLASDLSNIEQSVALLRARRSNTFTEYDGAIGASGGVSYNEKNLYSVSALELLQDCAHRYYFREVLKLDHDLEGIDEVVHREAGNVIHEVLRAFFTIQSQQKLDLSSKKGFSDACKLLLRLALDSFRLSSIDWDRLVVFKQAKETVLGGLDSADDDVKRGILKAALIFERDCMITQPHSLEFSFGFSQEKSPALKLESSLGAFAVRGIIDRIDVSKADSSLAVWDYKTGTAPSVRRIVEGKSFQLALYAAAVQQNLEPHKLPTKAGYVVLSKPQMNAEEMQDPRNGAVRPLLGLAERGKQHSSELIEERVRETISKVSALHEKVVTGQFQQQLDTDGCDYCEFYRICARNPALIEKKQSHAIEEELVVDDELATVSPLSSASEPKVFKLSTEQELASDVNKSILLNAGAGSGKTAVLQTRVIELILKGVSPFSILAITFTEKAAQEIRNRIEIALQDVLKRNTFLERQLSSEERIRALEALNALCDVQISTIHAFCARLMAMCPPQLGIVTTGNVVDSAMQMRLVTESVSEALRTAHHTVGSVEYDSLWRLLSHGIKYNQLSENVRKLVLDRRSTFKLARILGVKGSEQQAKDELIQRLTQQFSQTESAVDLELSLFLDSWTKSFDSWLSAPPKPLTTEQQALAETLREKVSKLRTLIKIQDAKRFLAAVNLLDFLKSLDNPLGKAVRGKHPNYWNQLRDSLLDQDLDVLISGLESDRAGLELAQSVLELVFSASNIYQRRKQYQGVVDFDDLIFTARELVCGELLAEEDRKSLVARVRTRVKHVMVDEFQDTDDLQWDVIRAVSGVGERSLENDSENTLFIVGDAQQAIYSFRGGDVRVFRQAAEEVVNGGATRLSLRDNYRSNEKILEFVNNFFAKLFAADFDSDGSTRFGVQAQQMVAGKQQERVPENALAVLYDDGSTKPKGKSAQLVDEAARVAKFTRSVLLNPEPWSGLANCGKGPKIAILCRTVSQLTRVREALETEGVPFSISHSAGFYELEEIVQLENVLKVLANPADKIALVGVLRSAIFGMSDLEIYSLGVSCDFNWQHILAGKCAANPLPDKVSSWFCRVQHFARRAPSSLVLEMLMRESKMEFAYAAVGYSEAYRNIERFVDKLHLSELRGAVGNTAADALLWIETQRHEGSAAPNANNADHPVVLTTVHGAKGLEYPMVILPFLRGPKNRQADFLIGEIENGIPYLGIKVEDPEQEFRRDRTFAMMRLSESLKAQMCSEERRIFYVACTRAEQHLVLSLQVGKDRKRRLGEAVSNDAEQKLKLRESADSVDWLCELVKFDDAESPKALLLQKGDDADDVIKLPLV